MQIRHVGLPCYTGLQGTDDHESQLRFGQGIRNWLRRSSFYCISLVITPILSSVQGRTLHEPACKISSLLLFCIGAAGRLYETLFIQLDGRLNSMIDLGKI